MARFLVSLVATVIFVQASGLVTQIAKFAIENIVSFGLESAFNQIIDDGTSEKLDQILMAQKAVNQSLHNIEDKLSQLQDQLFFQNAWKTEIKIRFLFHRHHIITKAIHDLKLRHGNGHENNTEATLIKSSIDSFNDELKNIPRLLFEFNKDIIGGGTAGHVRGVACVTVENRFKSNPKNMKKGVSEIKNISESLKELQVLAFQLYNSSCYEYSGVCKQEEAKLESNLKEQDSRFASCMPSFFTDIVDQNVSKNMHICSPKTGACLYSKQTQSVVKDGRFDWGKFNCPEDAGLRCPVGDGHDVWFFEKVPAHKELMYFLRRKNGCYLSFDNSFLVFKKNVATTWAEKIERKRFLICQPEKSTNAVTFRIKPVEYTTNSTYTLEEVSTGMYLNVHVETTGVHVDISHRLVLPLFLHDSPASWILVPEGEKRDKCDASAPIHCTDAYDGGNYGMLIGSGIAFIAVIFVVGTGLVVYCRRSERCSCCACNVYHW